MSAMIRCAFLGNQSHACSYEGGAYSKAATTALNHCEGSLGPRLSPLNNGRRKPGNIHSKSCRLPLCHHTRDRL